MASHTPFADPASFSLRRHLADTTIGPAEMYALAVIYYPDPASIAVLCEHVTGSFRRKGSFRLLVGLYAAQVFDMLDLDAGAFDSIARCRSRGKIEACAVDLVHRASEADLLEGLCTARTVFTGGSTFAFRDCPVFVSDLFAAHASDGALTDRVVAEMSLMCWDAALLSPELGLVPRKQAPTRDIRYTHRAARAAARLLLSRFGTHVPSWDMFKHMYTRDASVGDVVDLVAAVEQNS